MAASLTWHTARVVGNGGAGILEEEIMGLFDGMTNDRSPISGKELSDFREEYKHIPDLKPGDKLVWKGRWARNCKLPQMDQVIEVFEVFPIRCGKNEGSNHDLDEDNFSAVFEDENDGERSVYAFDSRRFKRI